MCQEAGRWKTSQIAWKQTLVGRKRLKRRGLQSTDNSVSDLRIPNTAVADQ